MLSNSCSQFHEKQIEYFFNKIEQLGTQLNNRSISLVVEFTKSSYTKIKERGLNFLWNLVTQENVKGEQQELQTFGLKLLTKLMSDYNMTEKRFEESSFRFKKEKIIFWQNLLGSIWWNYA